MLRWLDPILNPMACLPAMPEAAQSPQNTEALLARLENLLRHPLRYALSGDKKSLLRGQGLDFADLREYTPGDDIRKIDWNVFARTLSPHVREYQEEKQLTLWLVLDCTPSMHFGKTRAKIHLATELAGLFALMAERSGHRLGAALIHQKLEIIPPRSGRAQVQHIVERVQRRVAETSSARMRGESLQHAFQQLVSVIQKHSTVMVFSDFLAMENAWNIPLGQLSRQNKLLMFYMQDATEKKLPAGLGFLPLVNPETGQSVWFDTSDVRAIKAYREAFIQQAQQTVQRLKTIGTVLEADSAEEPDAVLLRLFRQERSLVS